MFDNYKTKSLQQYLALMNNHTMPAGVTILGCHEHVLYQQ